MNWSETADRRRKDLAYLEGMDGDNPTGEIAIMMAQSNATLALATAEQMAERGKPQAPSHRPHPGFRVCQSCQASLLADTIVCPFCKSKDGNPPLPDTAKEPNPKPNDPTKPSPPAEPCDHGHAKYTKKVTYWLECLKPRCGVKYETTKERYDEAPNSAG